MTPRRSVALAAAAAATALLWLTSGWATDPAPTSVRNVAAIGFVGAIVLTAIAVRSAPLGIIAPSSVFLAIYTLFDFGALPVVLFPGLMTDDRISSISLWIDDASAMPTAVAAALLGLAGLALGAHLGRRLGPPPRARVATGRFPHLTVARIALVGSVLMVTAVTWWVVVIVRSLGPSGLISGYGPYLTIPGRNRLSLAYIGIGIAAVLLAAIPWRRGMWPAAVVGVAFSLLALPMGLRGEVMFPAAAAIAVAGVRRARPLSRRATQVALLGILVALSGIAALRVIRQSEIAALPIRELISSPLDGVIEMGASLRPVVETVRWGNAGDGFALGATYWAPFDRVVSRLLGNSTPVGSDDRVMNVVVTNRVGAIGYSSAAEAYRNFGLAGAFGVHLLLGMFLGRFERPESDTLRLVVGGVVMYPLLIHIRNAFIFVPVWIGYGLSVVLAAAALSRWWPPHDEDDATLSGPAGPAASGGAA